MAKWEMIGAKDGPRGKRMAMSTENSDLLAKPRVGQQVTIEMLRRTVVDGKPVDIGDQVITDARTAKTLIGMSIPTAKLVAPVAKRAKSKS